jgi:hypothetical protein
MYQHIKYSKVFKPACHIDKVKKYSAAPVMHICRMPGLRKGIIVGIYDLLIADDELSILNMPAQVAGAKVGFPCIK